MSGLASPSQFHTPDIPSGCSPPISAFVELEPDSNFIQQIAQSLSHIPRRLSASQTRSKSASARKRTKPNPSLSSAKRSRKSETSVSLEPPLSPIETLASVAAQADNVKSFERPSKRARSEAFIKPFDDHQSIMDFDSRPATSHIPSAKLAHSKSQSSDIHKTSKAGLEIVEMSAAQTLLSLWNSNLPQISLNHASNDQGQTNPITASENEEEGLVSVQTHTPPEEIAPPTPQERSLHKIDPSMHNIKSLDSRLVNEKHVNQLQSPQSLPSAGEIDEANLRKEVLELNGINTQGIDILASEKKKVKQKQKNVKETPKESQAFTVDEDTKCAKCGFFANSLVGETIQWTQCDGCEQWFHLSCTKIKPKEISRIDKYFCSSCEKTHGPPTFFRKSGRNRTNVDYKGLNEGNFSTIDEEYEHRYIHHFKDGNLKYVMPETFPRLNPEYLTSEYLGRLPSFNEPILIPASLNPRPYEESNLLIQEAENEPTLQILKGAEESLDAQEIIYDEAQDKLDMVIPEDLTVRRVAEIYGPEQPIEVIDVKAQEGDASKKWTVGKWADYYENPGDKPIRNVISLEVSKSPMGRILRRPKVVRDLDLQDSVWPDSDISRVMVKFYVLMGVKDCYTDFHIDFGGSSVFYHIVRGRKVFFFIPPKQSNLKKYEQWNKTAAQNHTFLPDQTKECYRVDLYPGDTMLIPSGWIHAVWTPADSLVIGGNFLTRLHLGMQIKIHEIEKACQVPIKYRYPHFQKVMWYTLIDYLDKDPTPSSVVDQLIVEKKPFIRQTPVWFDDQDDCTDQEDLELFNARYYAKSEVEGWGDLIQFLWRTVLIYHDRIDGMTKEKRAAVIKSIPKTHGDPLDLIQKFTIWVSWKTGNILPHDWAYPSYELPSKAEVKAGDKELKLPSKKNPERITHRLGPKKVVCDICREKKVACKHVDQTVVTNGPTNESNECNQAISLIPPSTPTMEAVAITIESFVPVEVPREESLENADVNSKSIIEIKTDQETTPPSFKHQQLQAPNTEGKRRWGKACVDCRRSKRRCIHEESGKVDPNKQSNGNKSQRKGSFGEDGYPNESAIIDDDLTMTMEIDEVTPKVEAEELEIDPALLDLSLKDNMLGNGDNEYANGDEMTTSATNNDVSVLPTLNRQSRRLSKPVERFNPSLLDQTSSLNPAASPQRQARRSKSVANGTSMSPPGSSSGRSMKMISLTVPEGLTPEEEESWRVALQLQQEEFGLRSRRS